MICCNKWAHNIRHTEKQPQHLSLPCGDPGQLKIRTELVDIYIFFNVLLMSFNPYNTHLYKLKNKILHENILWL